MSIEKEPGERSKEKGARKRTRRNEPGEMGKRERS